MAVEEAVNKGTVTLVEDGESKSQQQIEKDLIAAAAAKGAGDPPAGDPPAGVEATEAQVLSFMNKKDDVEYESMSDYLEKQKVTVEKEAVLPEDIATYVKFQKETGRSLADFMSLNKDIDSVPADSLLADHIRATNEDLDDDDVAYMMKKFTYDSESDDEDDEAQKKLASKVALKDAKKYFNDLKETYKVPLESSKGNLAEKDTEELEALRATAQTAKSLGETNVAKSDWFQKKTDELFNEKFEGFEIKVGEATIPFQLGTSDELKVSNATPQNFIGKFLDDKGMLKDAKGYHRGLAIAMNPEKFAQMMYEQGQADLIKEQAGGQNNVRMTARQKQGRMNDGKLSVTVEESVHPSSGGLRFGRKKK